jgi:hypothetical protein
LERTLGNTPADIIKDIISSGIMTSLPVLFVVLSSDSSFQSSSAVQLAVIISAIYHLQNRYL